MEEIQRARGMKGGACFNMWALVTSVLLLLIAQGARGDPGRKEHRGPTLRTEPPSRVEFSNSSGAELRCAADGSPAPRLAWQTRDGGAARDVPGLRHARPDGTLVFPPFGRADYRQDVHDAVYQCTAANGVGAVASREVHVRGVMKQRFSPQVYDDFVVSGNTAVLRCHLPSFAREYVAVDSWLRSDDLVLKMADTRARSHTVLFSGELLLHETQERDSSWSYRCQTRHRLTGEMVVSVSAGKITVTEPHASTLPRLTFNQPQVRAEEGGPAQLPCVAQGNPPPSYRWMKDVGGVLRPVKEDGRVWLVQGTLNVKRVLQADGGKYQCIVRNSIGERRVESALVVTAPLSASLLPAQQTLNIGQDATFTCNVTGYPVHAVSWKKDQRPVSPGSRLLSREVLHVPAVRREDRGMYQCFAHNDLDSAQAAAELRISDVPPSLISVFPEQTAQPGEPVSLKCVSTGNPAPRISWSLDGAPAPTGAPRFSAGEFATEQGHVVGFLNVSEARAEDGGEYACHVANDVGAASHASRLNVYGPAFVRAMGNVTAVSGDDMTVRCPYGGFPIKSVRWLKGGILLPLNHRQKVSHGGLLTIQGVQRAADEGEYSCAVRGVDGQAVSGTTHVAVVVSPMIDPHFFRESNTVDEGARTKLVCIVTRGDPPLRFHWLKNGLPFLAHGDTAVQTTEDSSIVTFKRVTSADRGQYACVATNVASSANRTMQLIVNVPPQWTAEPRNTSVVLGNTVWLDCAAVGFPAPSVLWKKLVYTENTAGDFASVHSSPRAHRYNNGTLVLSDAEDSDSGAYLCQAGNGIGAGLTKIVALQVLVPPRFKEPYQNRAVREGANATLKCDAVGHAPIVVTWHRNKAVLDVQNTPRFFVRSISKKHQTISELQVTNASRNDTGMYTCAAVSDIGTDETLIQFVVQGLPDAPSNVTIVNTTSRSVSLQWDVAHNGNSHITGSTVQYQTISDASWNGQTSQLIVSGSDTSATLRGLVPVTLYFVRVMAENAMGQSAAGDVLNVTTEEEAPAGYPRDVQVHSTGAQSMKVSWKPPSEELQFGNVKGYYIGYKVSSSTENYTYKQVERAVDSGQQFTYITGLQPFTKYDIVVKAYNSAGSGPKSNKIMGKTLETAPPTSPIVQVAETTTSTIDMHWKKDVKDNSAITEYTLHYKTDDGDWRQERLSSNTERYTLTGLRCGTRYHLYMTASNSLGTGEPSVPVLARTMGAAPTSPPRQAAFLRADASSVRLELAAWRSGGCPIGRFSVQYRPKYQSKWTTVSEGLESDSLVVRHLSPDREYSVMVTAHSDAGLTQGEYAFRTLSASALAPTSSPAYGKRETDLPFYKNIALVVPVVVSSLVIMVLLFAIVFCFRKHSQDRRDYDNRKPCGDSLMMGDMTKEITTKSTKFSHYSCPEGNKGDYAEPYVCNDSVTSRQTADGGLFATIKRCPTRPIYTSGSYKQGSESFCGQQHGGAAQGGGARSESGQVPAEKWSQPRGKPAR